MKSFIVVLMMFSVNGFAAAKESLPPSPSPSASASAGASASSQVGIQTNQTTTYTSQAKENVPTTIAPALASSDDTCMGSVSGSVAGLGFGVSLGKTYTDTNCILLKNSRQLWNMGLNSEAVQLLCNNKDMRSVLGAKCPVHEEGN